MATINEIQAQINELQEQLNSLKNEPSIEVTTITAAEGKVFKRIHDGFIIGNSITLGYDYSIGFKRIDKPEFYREIEDPYKNEQEQQDQN